MRINTPFMAPEFEARDVSGQPVSLAALRGRRVLLSFFRDAVCPFCNLRVYELSNEHASLQAAGLEVLVFFRSSHEDVTRFVTRRPRPFAVVADPGMQIYGRYGVEHSLTGLMRAMMRRLPRLLRGLRLGGARLPAGDPSLMPADFLIDERGYVQQAHYGRDLGDHLPLDTVQAFANRRR